MKYPVSNNDLIDIELENTMKIIQETVSLIHYIRKNNNIKVRQPLSKVTLFSEGNINFFYKFKDIILSETNIKNLQISNDCSNFFTYNVKPNFKILGTKYKDLINEISSEIKNLNEKQINEFKKKCNILLNNGIKINADECIFELKPKENICVGEFNNVIVAVDNNITEDLKEECIARDFINLIQNYRKTKSFKIDDEIEISLYSDDKFILKAISNNLKLITNALLCKKLEITDKTDILEPLTLNESKIYVHTKILN